MFCAARSSSSGAATAPPMALAIQQQLLLLSYICTTGAGGAWPADAPFDRLLQRPRSTGVDICASPLAPLGAAALPAQHGQHGVPSGRVDTANATLIAGFVSDPDSPSTPLTVQIRIDGVLRDQQLTTPAASGSGHRFSWAVNQILGPADTNHTVEVVVMGVDSSGAVDGMGVVLPGGGHINGSCAPIPEDCGPPGGTAVQEQCSLGAWCYDVPCYWQQRPLDTQYVENGHVRAGVNTAFGGTVFSLRKSTSNLPLPVVCSTSHNVVSDS